MNTFKTRNLLTITALLLAIVSAPVGAADYFWDGGGLDNLWDTSANWDVPLVFPDAVDIVFTENVLHHSPLCVAISWTN